MMAGAELPNIKIDLRVPLASRLLRILAGGFHQAADDQSAKPLYPEVRLIG